MKDLPLITAHESYTFVKNQGFTFGHHLKESFIGISVKNLIIIAAWASDTKIK